MSRNRKSKRRLQLEERFRAGATVCLENLGDQAGRFYKLELDTPAGLLRLSVYGDWIACRFDDVEFGKRFTHCCDPAGNPYSGKRNFINGISGPFDPDQSLANFRNHLEQLMNWQTAVA
jgi:hypothetical protein